MKQVITKVWTLLGEVTDDDIELLRRANFDFSIVTDDYPIDTVGFHNRSWVKVNQDLQITTDSSEQETWLRLCFGDRLHHFSTRYNM